MNLHKFNPVVVANILWLAFVEYPRLDKKRQTGVEILEEVDRMMAHWKVEQQLRHLDKGLECLDIGKDLMGNQRSFLLELDLDSLILKRDLMVDNLMDRLDKER